MTADTGSIVARSRHVLAVTATHAVVIPTVPSQPGRAVARRRAASLPGRTRTM
jgi:hypothetical protein